MSQVQDIFKEYLTFDVIVFGQSARHINELLYKSVSPNYISNLWGYYVYIRILLCIVNISSAYFSRSQYSIKPRQHIVINFPFQDTQNVKYIFQGTAVFFKTRFFFKRWVNSSPLVDSSYLTQRPLKDTGISLCVPFANHF